MSKQHKDPTKRHRHDIGDVDHGPLSTESTTRSIQGLLGLFVIGSAGLTIWALVQMLG